MSGKREKRKRAEQRYEYQRQYECWRQEEPPRIFFISWRRWRKREPKMREGATR